VEVEWGCEVEAEHEADHERDGEEEDCWLVVERPCPASSGGAAQMDLACHWPCAFSRPS